jgi:RND family efflux transporter MFP subunit
MRRPASLPPPRGRRRRIARWCRHAGRLGLLLPLLASCDDDTAAVRLPPAPRAATATRSPAAPSTPAERGWVGVIAPAQTADIAATFAGQLRMVHVRSGDRVAAGAPLAQIDDRQVREELAMAEAELRSAGAAARAAAVDLAEAERLVTAERALVAQGHSPQRRLEEVGFQRQRAQAGLSRSHAAEAEARARVQQARRRLAEAVLRAPFAGTVAARYHDPGATTAPGTPVVRLIGDGGLWVRFAAPPAARAQLAIGNRVEVSIEAIGTTTAVLRQVAPELDPASNLLFAEAALDVPPPSLAGRISPRAAAWVRPLQR